MTHSTAHTGKLLFWSFTVALGGFLFGFDTAVISGAEQAIQRQWGLSDALLGAMVSSALVGTVIGAIFGGIPCDRYGRKTTLFWIGVLYLVSALGSALAPDIYTLMLFRFIGGLGVGASSVAAPVYISEIAPTPLRGRLTAMFQFNLVFGILCAYLSNYWVAGAGGDWRMMLGVEVLPALLFVILILFVPRSPRWLIARRGDREGARKVLAQIDPARADLALEEIESSHTETATTQASPQTAEWRDFLSGRYRWPIILAFLFAFFNQVSGINAVIYYAPRIFSMAGMEDSAALLSSAGVGLINLVFTLIGLALIDRLGRRLLMYVGSIGYIVSLVSLALVFQWEAFNGSLVPLLIFVFIASHAIGQGACIWVFIAEIFPNRVRGFGMSLGSGTHWVFAALVAFSFPAIAGSLGGAPIFGFFALMMVLQLLFVRYWMPETKGVSLEALEQQLSKR